MIFESRESKHTMNVWQRKFALIPTRVGKKEGQTIFAWLEHYEERRDSYDGMVSRRSLPLSEDIQDYNGYPLTSLFCS